MPVVAGPRRRWRRDRARRPSRARGRPPRRGHRPTRLRNSRPSPRPMTMSRGVSRQRPRGAATRRASPPRRRQSSGRRIYKEKLRCQGRAASSLVSTGAASYSGSARRKPVHRLRLIEQICSSAPAHSTPVLRRGRPKSSLGAIFFPTYTAHLRQPQKICSRESHRASCTDREKFSATGNCHRHHCSKTSKCIIQLCTTRL